MSSSLVFCQFRMFSTSAAAKGKEDRLTLDVEVVAVAHRGFQEHSDGERQLLQTGVVERLQVEVVEGFVAHGE